jgi:hypothetical protein
MSAGVALGWKEICRALGGVSRQTAMRWVRNFGLPVYKPAGKPMMLLADRDEWLRSEQAPRVPANPARRRAGKE